MSLPRRLYPSTFLGSDITDTTIMCCGFSRHSTAWSAESVGFLTFREILLYCCNFPQVWVRFRTPSQRAWHHFPARSHCLSVCLGSYLPAQRATPYMGEVWELARPQWAWSYCWVSHSSWQNSHWSHMHVPLSVNDHGFSRYVTGMISNALSFLSIRMSDQGT